MTESKKRKFNPLDINVKVGLDARGGMKAVNQFAQEYGVHPV
jgi:transposase